MTRNQRAAAVAIAATLVACGAGAIAIGATARPQRQSPPLPVVAVVPSSVPASASPSPIITRSTLAPKPPKVTTAAAPVEQPADAYYGNCAAARAAGAAPLHRGDPGYRRGLDRDGNGVACE